MFSGNNALAYEYLYGNGFLEEIEGGKSTAHAFKPSCLLREIYILPEDTYRLSDLPSVLTKRQLGVEGEIIAEQFLEEHGYEVLERNWRCSFGEMDVVARDEGGTVVLLEVKTRRVRRFNDSMPEVAVNFEKQAKYCTLAAMYLMEHHEVESLRFDVIAISAMDFEPLHLRHISGAFVWDE